MYGFIQIRLNINTIFRFNAPSFSPSFRSLLYIWFAQVVIVIIALFITTICKATSAFVFYRQNITYLSLYAYVHNNSWLIINALLCYYIHIIIRARRREKGRRQRSRRGLWYSDLLHDLATLIYSATASLPSNTTPLYRQAGWPSGHSSTRVWRPPEKLPTGHRFDPRHHKSPIWPRVLTLPIIRKRKPSGLLSILWKSSIRLSLSRRVFVLQRKVGRWCLLC